MNAIQTTLDKLFSKTLPKEAVKASMSSEDYELVSKTLRPYNISSFEDTIKLKSLTVFKKFQLNQVNGYKKSVILSRIEAQELQAALEFRVRLHLKQFEQISELFRMSSLSYLDVESKRGFDSRLMDDLDLDMALFKKYAKFDGLPFGLGIYNGQLPELTRKLWFCQKVLRQALYLSQEENVHLHLVSSDDPDVGGDPLCATVLVGENNLFDFYFEQKLFKELKSSLLLYKKMKQFELVTVLYFLKRKPYSYVKLESDLKQSGLLDVMEKLKEKAKHSESWAESLLRLDGAISSFSYPNRARKIRLKNYLNDPDIKTVWNKYKECFEFLEKKENQWVITHNSKNMHCGYFFVLKRKHEKPIDF